MTSEEFDTASDLANIKMARKLLLEVNKSEHTKDMDTVLIQISKMEIGLRKSVQIDDEGEEVEPSQNDKNEIDMSELR
jgi:hypothetical protein